ncbi:L,D-transpeptidase family protein [Sulfurimonas autotrophica]|uniref:ErfK/YbiS/YcfS/YnhG family protein n=1 Tax=Sulfurimonas autotrophica (strain ATCC BAA-671 / DSM 16294 / JCM 11897 / OK10) TaxID=563040 RepID=E0URB1_SULAO|nr:L,D-transpeptidase family protein [Sulfurimonas autotrophica]ADN08921.1 ErfK/YbiS/YcfS/YnhG family protein [Sulfurimonas autotrophica DSM 16294]
MENKFYTRTVNILLTLFLSTSIFASDNKILTNYRLHGIKNIEKALDKSLTETTYWKEYLKNKDTKFGYIESYTNILLCDKSKSELLIYSKDSNNTYKLRKEYSAFTGKLKGDKRKEGDLKTPIGVYDIIKKISKVDSFYGPMAFVTSYPNLYDRYEGKTGQGIWIHGLPTNQERDAFTKGCIAINNKSIECMNRNIDIKKTVLIIKENANDSTTPSKKTLSQLLSTLYAWRYAWLYNETENYLNFYAPEFKRYDGMDFKRFKKYKTRIFAKYESKTILFRNINIVTYPNMKSVYRITFDEEYKSNSFSFNGRKVLIVKLQDNKFNIITEK